VCCLEKGEKRLLSFLVDRSILEEKDTLSWEKGGEGGAATFSRKRRSCEGAGAGFLLKSAFRDVPTPVNAKSALQRF